MICRSGMPMKLTLAVLQVIRAKAALWSVVGTDWEACRPVQGPKDGYQLEELPQQAENEATECQHEPDAERAYDQTGESQRHVLQQESQRQDHNP